MPLFCTNPSAPARARRPCWCSFKTLLVLWCVLLLGGGAQASHLLGGEMSYQYLDASGPGGRPFRYVLTVGIYINADTIAGSPTQSQVPYGRTSLRVGIYQKGGVLDGEAIDLVILPRVSLRFATPQPTPGCPPTTPVRLALYRDTVALPLSAAGYYAYVSDGTRNASIRNIDTIARPSDQENMTLYLDMAPPLVPNSSPTFADTAVALVCQGDTAILINNASDVDGDRLAYSFGIPYSASPSGPNTIPPARFVPPPVLVQYAPGYSLAQPFGTGAGNLALLDASTGLSTYRALNQGRYVVAVDVSEYRRINGSEVLVGRSRRDIQLVVRLCPAGASPALAPPTVVPRSYTIEEGETLSFPIAATTSVPTEPLTLKVNSTLLDGPGGIGASYNGLPGTVAAGQSTGIVSIQGTGAASAAFQLSTRCGTARATPFDILVTATSRDCRKKATSAIFRVSIGPATGPRRIGGDSLICDAAQLRSYAPVGPAMGRYRWRVRGGTIVGPDTSRTVQVRWSAAPGPAELVLGGTSRFGCPLDSLRRAVVVLARPQLAVAGPLSICPGSSTTLTISGGATAYTLTGGGLSLSSAGQFVLAPPVTTTYTIASATAAGCPLATTVTVAVVPSVPLAVSGSLAVCAGSSTVLSVAGGVGSYTLTGGGQTLSGPGPFALAPGVTTAYTITGTTAAGCPSSAAVTVVVNPVPPLSLRVPALTCAGTPASLEVSGGSGPYTLSGGGLSFTGPGPFVVSPLLTTTYTVTGATAAGCPFSATATVEVASCPEPDRTLQFYNIVSSNNDGLNDVFTIKNVEFYPGNTLSIFNRWGRLVFRTTNYRNSWGNSPDVAPGVYSYLFRLANGQTTKGWVEVVK